MVQRTYNSVGVSTILFILGDKNAWRISCNCCRIAIYVWSNKLFMSLIIEKHDNHPVKHSAIDNDLTDVIIADEVFDDNI